MKLIKLTLSSLAIIILIASCATSAPTRFYTLSVPVQSQQSTAKATTIAIEVLPVNVPERLKRPQLVINTQGAQLKVLEQDRWSSSFNDELHDVFASGIANQTGALEVSHGGRVANQAIYRIAITLRQLDAVPGGNIVADFAWTITRVDVGSRNIDPTSAKDHAISCQLALTKPVGSSIDAMVQGMQATVAEVVAAISANIVSLNANKEAECG